MTHFYCVGWMHRLNAPASCQFCALDVGCACVHEWLASACWGFHWVVHHDTLLCSSLMVLCRSACVCCVGGWQGFWWWQATQLWTWAFRWQPGVLVPNTGSVLHVTIWCLL